MADPPRSMRKRTGYSYQLWCKLKFFFVLLEEAFFLICDKFFIAKRRNSIYFHLYMCAKNPQFKIVSNFLEVKVSRGSGLLQGLLVQPYHQPFVQL